MSAEIIFKYFPRLSEEQVQRFTMLGELYEHWNAQINVISRKDMDQLYERHVLHSLAIYKFLPFQPGTKILDIGTGGGFPGIPLAIMQPDVNFLLVDSIGKKIKVVEEIAAALQLKNVRAKHERAEKIKETFDFVVTRAVAEMPMLLSWCQNKILKKQINGLPNGLICLKGGDLKEELQGVKRHKDVFPLTDYFKEAFFETKKIIYVPLV